jgi:hypothetical protein
MMIFKKRNSGRFPVQNKETRIIRHNSFANDYALVSMPKTAWYWLDDLVKSAYPHGGYRALVRTFGKEANCPDSLSRSLLAKAQEHFETRMAGLYGLANDNVPASGYDYGLKPSQANPSAPRYSLRLPAVYRIFHFMPHATYLTTVWERKNYHLRDAPTTERPN